MSKVMTRGYELDSFGRPMPTPAPDAEPVPDQQRAPVWTDSMLKFWGVINGR